MGFYDEFWAICYGNGIDGDWRRAGSYEDAKLIAREESDRSSSPVAIAPAHYPHPFHYIFLDDLIERMDEEAVNNDCYCDDGPIFEYIDQGKAEAELERWALKHIKTLLFTVDIEKAEFIGPN
jgi:hypothetical protein